MYNKLLISAGGGIISFKQQAEQENCATIAIGLGGTGISCLRTLKKEVFTRVKPDDPESLIAKYKHIKYLAIDTDKNSLGDSGAIDTLDSNTEFFNISCPDISGLLSQAHILAQDPSLTWLKTQGTQGNGSGISILSAEAGAGGIRQIGRLLLVQRSKTLVEKLTHLITEARHDLTGNASLNIHIFTGLAGGTGAGTFLDVCYLVQYTLAQLGLAGQAYTCGYFFMPDVNMANHPADYIPVNGFASMKELDYCMNYTNNGGEWDQQYDGFTIRTSQPPVKLAHLITATDSDGHIVSNAYNYAMHVAVDYVLEYIIKPYINEGENITEGVFTIKSHIANVNTHVGLVNKKHGACYSYCVLGASNAYLPYKEITTYLTSKIFEGFGNLKNQHPSDNDIDAFITNNNLTYNEIYRELCERTPSVPNPAIDADTLYEQTEGLSEESIPQILSIMRDAGPKISGQIETNKSALLNTAATVASKDEAPKLSLIERVKSKLLDIAKQPTKGPYYASSMLNSLVARDLQKTIHGYLTQNEKALGLASADLNLRNQEVSETLSDLQSSNRLTRKKKAGAYSNAVHAYYVQHNKKNALQAMGSLLTDLEKQLSDLYTGFFAPFTAVMLKLQATFDANLVTLSEPLVADSGYAVKLMTIQNLQKSLDASVAEMDIPGQIHSFVTNMLDNPDTWISQDENKIAAKVNSYFLSQLSTYTGKTIDDYLQVKFGTTDPTLLMQKVYNEIITPLGGRAAPLFWNDSGLYHLSDSVSMGYLSIPNISSVIHAAAEQYVAANGDISIRNVAATDRITIFKFVCGVPLYGYQGVKTYEPAYILKQICGSHAYEGSVNNNKDSRKLINVSPISCIAPDMLTPEEKENIAMYDFGRENGVITKVPVGGSFEYHLNVLDDGDVNALIGEIQNLMTSEDALKISNFLDSVKDRALKIKKYKVIPMTQNNDYAELVVRDNVLGSLTNAKILIEQTALIKAYNEKLCELRERLKSAGEARTNNHDFAMAIITGVIKRVNDYEYSYCFETYGVEESVQMTTIDSVPFGMSMPLYSAYLGYCKADAEVKENIKASVRDTLLHNKESAVATVAEVRTWITPEKNNAMLSTAKSLFPAELQNILAFIKSFAMEVNNFAAGM